MAELSSSRCIYINLVFPLVLVPFSLQIGFDSTPPLSLIFYLDSPPGPFVFPFHHSPSLVLTSGSFRVPWVLVVVEGSVSPSPPLESFVYSDFKLVAKPSLD